MELVIRSSAILLSVSILCLLIKKTNPEISILVSLAAVCIVIIASLNFFNGAKELTDMVKRVYEVEDGFIAPVMKCLGISMITKFSCDICKEASQIAAASALELAGAICALSIASPMIVNMLKLIGGMI